MASKTQKTEHKRQHKTRKGGKTRKKLIERDGSTPTFAIHPKQAKVE